MPRAALDTTLAALADPARRGAVELLAGGPRRAGELAAALALSPPAMSRHLRVLRAGGLVEEERDEGDARARVYRLRRERFDELRSWLSEVEAFWSDQLASFRAHAERVQASGGRARRAAGEPAGSASEARAGRGGGEPREPQGAASMPRAAGERSRPEDAAGARRSMRERRAPAGAAGAPRAPGGRNAPGRGRTGRRP